MALLINHYIGLIQNENHNFFDVEHTHFCAPVKNFTRCTDDDVVVELGTSFNWNCEQLDFGMAVKD